MLTLRKIMKLLPDGDACHKVRQFNLKFAVEQRPPSVKEFAESLGFEVVLVDSPYGVSGQLVTDTWAKNGYRIEVNRRNSVVRQRWTVLHEIGHYFLHIEKEDVFATTKFRDISHLSYIGDEVKEEREANEFAAAVCFGEGTLRAAYSIFHGDISTLSKKFGLAPKAIEIGIQQYLPEKAKSVKRN